MTGEMAHWSTSKFPALGGAFKTFNPRGVDGLAGEDVDGGGDRSGVTDAVGTDDLDGVVASGGEGGGQGVASGVGLGAVDSPDEGGGQGSVGDEGDTFAGFGSFGTVKFDGGNHIESLDGDVVDIEEVLIFTVVIDGDVLGAGREEESSTLKDSPVVWPLYMNFTMYSP